MKTGDLVMLNSGGPTMTVNTAVPGNDSAKPARAASAICQWFDGRQVVTNEFPQASLVTVPRGLETLLEAYVQARRDERAAGAKLPQDGTIMSPSMEAERRAFGQARATRETIGQEILHLLVVAR